MLVVKYEDKAAEAVAAELKTVKTKLRGKAKYKGETELTVDVKVKKGDTAFVDKLSAIEGVSSAVVVEYTGE